MSDFTDCDYLILGGGSAGCVLAARLSEDASCSVVLVEAGGDVRDGAVPEDIASSYPGRAFLNPGHIWPQLTGLMGVGAGNAPMKRAPRRYEQARVLGGGSAINAMAANRGAPTDYAEWVQNGASGWGWDDVLPYFKKIESDQDFGGPLHGKDGLLPIRRSFAQDHSPFVQAASSVLQRQGFAAREDQNGVWEDGIFPVAIARGAKGERVPVSLAYLTSAVRARPNLRIITQASAHRLLTQGQRVVGAQIEMAGALRDIHARETILSCGALHTPALMMRSGIGPGAELQRHGIDVVAARAGVGRNLMEHPSLALSAYLKPHARLQDEQRHQIHACLRFSSRLGECPQGDMHMAMVAKSAWHPVGQRLGTLFVWVNKAYSRGEVTLASADPRAHPDVDFRLLSDARDRKRLADGLRLAAKVFADPAMRAVCDGAFPAAFSDRVRRVSMPTTRNGLQAALFGFMLDLAGPLRDRLVRDVITGGVTLDALLQDEQRMDAFLSLAAGGVWHPSGTCRMGVADDPMAVTDPSGRVYGVDGLRVADASLMPTIPCANTNMPTIMMAEKLSDLIRHTP